MATRTATAPRAASPTAPANDPAFGAVASTASAGAQKPEKTILGVKLRAICRSTVNSYSRGRAIPVQFRGRGAWTDNQIVSLPRIMDLAEIPWSAAKAYTGYAVHEVSHVRETDFDEVRRSYAEGKLVQAFANGIEDYRIERITSRIFKGAALDLAALRVYIHPNLADLPPQWFADPRKSGPIALTWTGANLNGFANPMFDATLACFPPPVRVLIDRWTAEMKDVRSTKGAVDLAIRFANEAEKYAQALKDAASDPDNDSDDNDGDADDQGGQSSGGDSDQGGQGTKSRRKASGKPATGTPAEDADDNDSTTDAEDADGSDGQDDHDDASGSDDTDDDAQANGDDAGDDDNPFGKMIDPQAAIDDLLDAMADQIAKSAADTGAPEDDPDPTDGEVDPSSVEEQIDAANSVAPQYDSECSTGHDTAPDDNSPHGQGAMRNSYNDRRIAPVDITGDGSVLQDLTSNAAGVISTTARTIRRLLQAADKSGTLTNRRSGVFDIRNISGIVRETGTVYKRTWQRPGETTLLATLVDMSGSMGGQKLGLAMTGGLAIAQAVNNTRIEHWMYGFAGYSPNVLIHEFAGPSSRSHEVRRRIDSYHNVSLGCTPTGEAIAAIGAMMDDADADRRVLLVLTDGEADDENVARAATNILLKRGIEVVAIGIQSPSVARWAPVAHQINDIAELPAALLATIDPRKR